MTNSEQVITRNQLADLEGVDPRTVHRWRMRGCPTVKLKNSKPMFVHSMVRAWLENQDAKRTKPAGA